MRTNVGITFPMSILLAAATLKGLGSKVKDRIRQWLDELIPVLLPPTPVPVPVPVKDDRRRR